MGPPDRDSSSLLSAKETEESSSLRIGARHDSAVDMCWRSPRERTKSPREIQRIGEAMCRAISAIGASVWTRVRQACRRRSSIKNRWGGTPTLRCQSLRKCVGESPCRRASSSKSWSSRQWVSIQRRTDATRSALPSRGRRGCANQALEYQLLTATVDAIDLVGERGGIKKVTWTDHPGGAARRAHRRSTRADDPW